MEKIIAIKAREILDSRGDPTVEVELETENHIKTIASVPSGASVGSYEAIELRDNDVSRYNGFGVLSAITNIKNVIAPAIIGMDIENQEMVDKTLIDLDGTPHKSKLGANAILAVSMACCKATAIKMQIPLFQYIAKISGISPKLPKPLFNFIEGAKHADNNLVIQEFLVIGDKDSFKQNYQEASEAFHRLKDILKERGLTIAVGHEGGFAPNLPSDEDALRLLKESSPNKIGLDMAGVVPKTLTIDKIVTQYPVYILEDPAEEDDISAWAEITKTYGQNVLIVGDDVFSTNTQRFTEGVEKGVANAVIVKPNQIGTVSEAIQFAKLAKEKGYKTIVSHRSGETEDTFISDFAVGIGSDFAKLGAPSRGERVSKYNRLLRIEEMISSQNA